MKLARKAGATSQIFQVFIRDSSSTTGAGLTGLAFNTASLTAYYHRDTDTTATAITLVTMTVGTFTSSGFKEIDATNMPGWYQFCPPNAAIASGAVSVSFHLKGATNMAPLPIEVDLDAQVDVTHWNGTAVSSPATAGIPDVNIKNINNVAAATPGASGGILISGSNAGTTTLAALTCTGTFTISDGIVVTRSTSNSTAVSFTGTGSGNGMNIVGGASITTTAAGVGLSITGGASSTSAGGVAGVGIKVLGGAGSASTNGAESAVTFTGGGTNTVASNAYGMLVTGTSTGDGGRFSSGAGATGTGLTAIAASTNGNGMSCVGTGTAPGIRTAGGATGHGIRTIGGATSGHGLQCEATAGCGINAAGAGTTNAGITATGGATTSAGLSLIGGATSGAGLLIRTTSGHGVDIAATGTSMHGATITGGNGGTSDGLKCVAGTGGVDIRGNITGNITGTLSTVTTVTNQLTAAQIATGIWQDTTAGDFTTASSIGKALYTGNFVPGAAGGLFIAGSNAATTVNITGNITGNLSGSVGSVTGAVGSVTAGVTVTTNNDKTGYSLTQTFPTNFSSLSIDASGRVDVIKIAGTTQTARDIGASVLLSSGTGTGQILLSSGTITVGTNNDKTGYSLTQAFPTNFSSLSITAAGLVAPVSNIKKNTALAKFMFTMTDSTTGAEKTGLVVTGTVSIDGAAFGALTNAVSEVANGWYKVDLAAADLNGNNIALRFTATGAVVRDIAFITQP